MNSFIAYRAAPETTIIWHELAKHNAIMKKIPSKVWYGIIASRACCTIDQGKKMIKQYCRNTDKRAIDHSVKLDMLRASTEKENRFVVCLQLIERKKINGILEKFTRYLNQYDTTCRLYIISKGELKEKIHAIV